MRPKNKEVILILNNYPVKRVFEEIKNGTKPAHHLYGIPFLNEAGYDTMIIDPVRKSFWKTVGKFLGKIPVLKIGDLDLQIRAFQKRREYDIIYAPCQDVTLLLGLLSFLGLFNKKIIAIAHHPIIQGRLSGIAKYIYYCQVAGHARWGALGSNVGSEIYKISKKSKPLNMHWGPDIKYYDSIACRDTTPTTDLIAIGRTGRDYQVLIDAFTNSNVIVEIYCTRHVGNTLTKNFTSNITLHLLEDPESLKYPELIALYRRSKIMAIPMFEQNTLCGLTSITDAIALGMPMIMTRNKNIDIDVEKEGIGLWVNAGAAGEWRSKVEELLLNDLLVGEMGIKSRRLGENKANLDIFNTELLSLLKNAQQ
jgi:hypothetical protein